MQETSALDVLQRQVGWSHAAGGGAAPPVIKAVLAVVVTDEVNAGVSGIVNRHVAGVDAFVGQQVENGLTEIIVAERGQIADAGALAAGRDRAVHGVATEG